MAVHSGGLEATAGPGLRRRARVRVSGDRVFTGLLRVVAASFVARLDANIAHTPLGPAARAALAQAKRLPLGVPDVHRLPAGQAHSLTRAAEGASLHSFHLGLAIAAALVAGGGLAGAIGVRNPGREVPAEECPGGQLVGASRHLARTAEPRATVGAELA